MTETPSSNRNTFFDFVDKNGTRIGVVGARQQYDGKFGIYLQAGNIGDVRVMTDGSNVFVEGINYLKTVYVSGESGYMIWRNGYCIQWGSTTFSSSGTTVSFLKTFANTNYNLQIGGVNNTLGTYCVGVLNVSASKTESSFKGQGWNVSAPRNINSNWIALGVLASGQY